MNDLDQWRELGQQLRVDSIRSSAAAGSGHPTSSMSAADLMAVLLSKYLHYDFDTPENPNNDHLIFSKGHASPLLYSMYKAAGAISDDKMLTFRQQGSRLQGHPTPVIPWVDVATGSLGQGLPIGVGVALAGKRLDRLPYRVWVLCGDSEMAEGSMWEAIEHAAFNELDNLTAIIDVNRLGQTGETMHGWNLEYFKDRFEACGWHAITIDGHDVHAIDMALGEAASVRGKPTCIIARTVKGQGDPEVANKNGAHGKVVPNPAETIRILGGERNLRIDVAKPLSDEQPHVFETSGPLELPRYELGGKEAVRKAYGDALAALGSANGKIVALDGEVGNSTYSEIFKKAHPERYFEMYIAEQQMVAAAVGMQVRGWRPYAATFAAFLSRAYDFVRMGAISQADMSLVGSHAGVSIGEDGPSQMALEDIASLRAVYGSTVLYPSDANQTAQLVAQMADLEGIVFLRTTREKTPIIYGPDESFRVGGSKVVRRSDDDAVTLIGAGITLHEAMKAADALREDGINARVIDLYSIKPIDAETLRAAARDTGRLVTAEDHWPEGGLGDAVLDVFADTDERPRIVKLAVRHLPGSATPAEQLATAGIDGDHIADAARSLLRGGLVGAGTGSGSSAYLERREADDVGSSRRE
jgi:transketolase